MTSHAIYNLKINPTKIYMFLWICSMECMSHNREILGKSGNKVTTGYSQNLFLKFLKRKPPWNQMVSLLSHMQFSIVSCCVGSSSKQQIKTADFI